MTRLTQKKGRNACVRRPYAARMMLGCAPPVSRCVFRKMFVRRLTAILVCFAVAVIAGDACASIVVPKAPLELSADDVLSASGESGATSTSSSSESQDSDRSAPLPQLDEIWRLGLAAYAGPIGSGSSSNMGGSSSPTFGSGSGLVAASNSGFQVDDALVGWLSQSRWLAIPVPPGVSLLRPPQAA